MSNWIKIVQNRNEWRRITQETNELLHPCNNNNNNKKKKKKKKRGLNRGDIDIILHVVERRV